MTLHVFNHLHPTINIALLLRAFNRLDHGVVSKFLTLVTPKFEFDVVVNGVKDSELQKKNVVAIFEHNKTISNPTPKEA